jgi:hypothetical protein
MAASVSFSSKKVKPPAMSEASNASAKIFNIKNVALF